MQECFRQYPEVYGAELADEEDAAAAVEGEGAAPAPEDGAIAKQAVEDEAGSTSPQPTSTEAKAITESPKEVQQATEPETTNKVEDATDANKAAEKKEIQEEQK